MEKEDDIFCATNLDVEHSATVETTQYVLKDHDSLKEGKKHEDIFKQHTWWVGWNCSIFMGMLNLGP